MNLSVIKQIGKIFGRESSGEAERISFADSIPKKTNTQLNAELAESQAPIFDELSSSKSSLYDDLGIKPYNPDELVVRKGISIFKKMQDDDQIRAVSMTKKYARLSTPWTIVSATSLAQDQEIAAFVRWCFDDMDGTLEGDLLEMLTALDYGFSITEIVWKLVEEGKYKGKIGLKALKTRKPDNFDFQTDKHDNLKYIIFTTGGEDVELKPDKFMIFSYGKTFDNFYGKSDYKAVYRNFWSKDVIIRFWNMWLERYPVPITIGWFPPGTPKAQRDDLLNILKKLQIATAAVLPDNLEVDIKEVASTGHEVFKEAVEFHNKSMARGILCPDLLGFTETTGPGSYALGKKHFDVFLLVLQYLGREIEETVMFEQLIKRLVNYNYSNVLEYPRFKFESIHEENIHARAQILQILITAGLIDPTEDWVREYLNLPKPDQSLSGRKYGSIIPHAQTSDEALTQYQTETGYRSLTEYEREAGFTAQKLFDTIEDWVAEGNAIIKAEVEKIVSDIVSQVKRKKILELSAVETGTAKAQAYKRIQEVTINPRQIRTGILNLLVYGYFLGKSDAKEEIEKALGESLKFAATSASALAPKEAMDYWKKKKVLVKPNEFKNMLDREKSKAFAIAGIIEKDTLESMQDLLLKSIDQGWSVADFQYQLKDRCIQYTGTAYRSDRTGEPIMPHHAEVILRTNFSDIYNLGKRQLFTDPDVADYVPALQYSAILDERTRPTHAAMDGLIYPSDDPIWKTWYPPCGYNCRCTVIPVTANQDFAVSDPPDPSVKPDPGFGGVLEEPRRRPRKPPVTGERPGAKPDLPQYQHITEEEWERIKSDIDTIPKMYNKDYVSTDEGIKTTAQRISIMRREFLKSMNVPDNFIDMATSEVQGWTLSSKSTAGGKYMGILNRLLGRNPTDRVSKSWTGAYEAAKAPIDDAMMRAYSLRMAYNQRALAKIFDTETITTYRGTGGDHARGILDNLRETGKRTFEYEQHPVHSETMNSDVADQFGSLIYRRKLDVQDVWDSCFTTQYFFAEEAEIISFSRLPSVKVELYGKLPRKLSELLSNDDQEEKEMQEKKFRKEKITDPKYPKGSYYKVDVETGEKTLVLPPDDDSIDWLKEVRERQKRSKPKSE